MDRQEWLNGLKEGDVVGICRNTYYGTDYTLVKITRITPKGIVRVQDVENPTYRDNFNFSNKCIKHTGGYSSIEYKMIPHEDALQGIKTQKDLAEKRKVADDIAEMLENKYKRIDLTYLQTIHQTLSDI